MTELDVLTAALAAGTAAGFSQTASSAVQDAVASLRKALTRLVTSAGADAQLLESVDQDQESWLASVRPLLAACGAPDDPQLLAAAHKVLDELEKASPAAGKYVVDTRGAQAVQIGDHATQTNTFH